MAWENSCPVRPATSVTSSLEYPGTTSLAIGAAIEMATSSPTTSRKRVGPLRGTSSGSTSSASSR